MSRAPKSLCAKPQNPLPPVRASLSPTIRIRAIRAVTVRERKLKQAIALLCLASFASAQEIAPQRPQAPIVVRPYLPVTVPPIREANSERLGQLVRAGMLYLTAQDAIALALENNIDIEVSRYNPFISAWDLAGGQG